MEDWEKDFLTRALREIQKYPNIIGSWGKAEPLYKEILKEVENAVLNKDYKKLGEIYLKYSFRISTYDDGDRLKTSPELVKIFLKTLNDINNGITYAGNFELKFFNEKELLNKLLLGQKTGTITLSDIKNQLDDGVRKVIEDNNKLITSNFDSIVKSLKAMEEKIENSTSTIVSNTSNIINGALTTIKNHKIISLVIFGFFFLALVNLYQREKKKEKQKGKEEKQKEILAIIKINEDLNPQGLTADQLRHTIDEIKKDCGGNEINAENKSKNSNWIIGGGLSILAVVSIFGLSPSIRNKTVAFAQNSFSMLRKSLLP